MGIGAADWQFLTDAGNLAFVGVWVVILSIFVLLILFAWNL